MYKPLSFFVDVFSSSISRVCFSISPVYCSTCSLSILIWLSRSWTAFRIFTTKSKHNTKTQNYQDFNVRHILHSCGTHKYLHIHCWRTLWTENKGRDKIRGPRWMKLTAQSSYMTWPRAAIDMEGRIGLYVKTGQRERTKRRNMTYT